MRPSPVQNYYSSTTSPSVEHTLHHPQPFRIPLSPPNRPGKLSGHRSNLISCTTMTMTRSHQWNAEIPSSVSNLNSEQQQQRQMTPSLSDHGLLTSHQNQPLPSTYTLYPSAHTCQSTQNQPSYYSTDSVHHVHVICFMNQEITPYANLYQVSTSHPEQLN